MGMSEIIKVMVVVMLFYSLAINLIVYTLPDDVKNIAEPFQNSDNYNVENMTSVFEESLQRQKDIPVVEVGALVFYSGNILVDLLVNFIYAIPEMIGFIIYTVMSLFSIPTFIINYVQLFVGGAFTILYVIGLIQMLIGVRTGRVI